MRAACAAFFGDTYGESEVGRTMPFSTDEDAIASSQFQREAASRGAGSNEVLALTESLFPLP